MTETESAEFNELKDSILKRGWSPGDGQRIIMFTTSDLARVEDAISDGVMTKDFIKTLRMVNGFHRCAVVVCYLLSVSFVFSLLPQ